MNIVDLTNRENELLEKIEKVVGLMEDQNIMLEKEGIFDEYKKLFNVYVGLHKKDLEALKRCLFLYWHALNEPTCYTGLSEFDSNQVEKVLNTLDHLLSQGNSDYELEWMLGYYSNWAYIFEPFPQFQFIHNKMKENNTSELPKKIDRNEMAKRGQMGMYWMSLTRFKESQ